MIILISGCNSSGKSAYAETLAAAALMPRYYIATMVPKNEENQRRIEKHRQQRAGLNFQTIEEPCYVGQVEIPSDSLVLLEDVSNLLANMIFMEHGTKEDALSQILTLGKKCRHLLAVTISGMSEEEYTGETADYIRAVNWLNGQLFSAADTVVELRNGEPIYRKVNCHGVS